eukprot:scaffold40752_cov31-Phaeocystis_antarctica.AAC.2
MRIIPNTWQPQVRSKKIPSTHNTPHTCPQGDFLALGDASSLEAHFHTTRRGPALSGFFSGGSLVLSIRRASSTSARSTSARRPPAFGPSYIARQAA